MGKKSRMSVLKRQREAKKLEKAAMKRERRERRGSDEAGEGEEESDVATSEDLAGYGFPVDEPDGGGGR